MVAPLMLGLAVLSRSRAWFPSEAVQGLTGAAVKGWGSEDGGESSGGHRTRER